MIRISKSPTADTRTCDFTKVSKETLLDSSKQHIFDVRKALDYFMSRVCQAGQVHDYDKLTDIDGFHADFLTGFKSHDWWDRHRKLNRHHLTESDGIPADVNLIDVLDFIADCVMAGMARSGSVYELKLPTELLNTAFQNTVTMLKSQIVVEEEPPHPPAEEVVGADVIERCTQCGGHPQSSIHMFRSHNAEIRTAAHAFVPDDYVAWLRFDNGTIKICDQDSPGAFRVWRRRPEQAALQKAGEGL